MEKLKVDMPICLMAYNKGIYADLLRSIYFLNKISYTLNLNFKLNNIISEVRKIDFFEKYNDTEKIFNYTSISCFESPNVPLLNIERNSYSATCALYEIDYDNYNLFNEFAWPEILSCFLEDLKSDFRELSIIFNINTIKEINDYKLTNEILFKFANDFSVWLTYNQIGFIDEKNIILHNDSLEICFTIEV